MIDLGLFSRPRVRLVRQTEIAECGLASLTMVANFHGLDIDLGTMRRRFEPSLRGTSLRNLIDVANLIGLIPRAVTVSLDKLSNLYSPAILHWNMNHFVVLERVSGAKALIHNPGGRSVWMPLDEVSNHFTGVALELRPSNSFQPRSERERLRLSQLWNRISGLRRALAQTFVLSIVLQIVLLASPYYMQLAIDTALPALDYNLLAVLAIGFGLLILINGAATLLRAFVLLHAGTSVSIGLSTNVVRHLLRLPIPWFEKRRSGDILSRLQSIGPIQKLLTESAVAALVDGILAAFTLALMFFYSAALAGIAVLAFVIQCLIKAVSFGFQREAQEGRIVAAGSEQTTQLETLRGITTIRLFNRESLRHAIWQSRLIDVTNADVRLARITIWQSTLSSLVVGLEAIFSIWLAVGLVMKGAGFSLGMVFAFMAYKAQFTKKAEALIEEVASFRMIELHLSRLSDIALSNEEDSFTQGSPVQRELKGAIQLSDVYFRYAPSDPMVLNGVTASFSQGEHIAITGPSGGGKSTLIKVMLGLITPSSGEVLVDGVPIERFDRRNFQRQVGAVLQDDHLFSGSLAENIAFFDEKISMEAVVLAAKAAAIHEDILTMPMQYETLVGDMGSTLSGGQRQRILLARALYKRPKILIMDEGTAHLDSAHERLVNQAIGEMGVTRIIVAHRRETIESASRVFVMRSGVLAPMATEDSRG